LPMETGSHGIFCSPAVVAVRLAGRRLVLRCASVDAYAAVWRIRLLWRTSDDGGGLGAFSGIHRSTFLLFRLGVVDSSRRFVYPFSCEGGGIPVGWFQSSISWPAAADLFSSLFLHRREADERSSFVRRFGGAIGRWCCGNQQCWNPLVKMGDGACLPSCALRSGATAAMGSLYVWAMLCVISILLNGLSVILGCTVHSFNIKSPFSFTKKEQILYLYLIANSIHNV
jgi:hypothetical protein